ncbi:MAG: hypothetical protein ACON5A_00620 [Candidatus Comchoanobacterales bacterium]
MNFLYRHFTLIIAALLLTHCAPTQPLYERQGILSIHSSEEHSHKYRISWRHYEHHEQVLIKSGFLTLASIDYEAHKITYKDLTQTLSMPPYPDHLSWLTDLPIETIFQQASMNLGFEQTIGLWHIHITADGIKAESQSQNIEIQWHTLESSINQF